METAKESLEAMGLTEWKWRTKNGTGGGVIPVRWLIV